MTNISEPPHCASCEELESRVLDLEDNNYELKTRVDDLEYIIDRMKDLFFEINQKSDKGLDLG